jgi:DNA-binding NtrC family response regulator
MPPTPHSLLLIELDPSVGASLVFALRDAGLVVHQASDIRTARELISRFRPDAALVDAHLAEAQVLGLITELHDAYPSMPVVLTSTDVENDCWKQARLAGVQGLLIKPFSASQLVSVLMRTMLASLTESPGRDPVMGQP